jgi:hypothetical protein
VVSQVAGAQVSGQPLPVQIGYQSHHRPVTNIDRRRPSFAQVSVTLADPRPDRRCPTGATSPSPTFTERDAFDYFVLRISFFHPVQRPLKEWNCGAADSTT